VCGGTLQPHTSVLKRSALKLTFSSRPNNVNSVAQISLSLGVACTTASLERTQPVRWCTSYTGAVHVTVKVSHRCCDCCVAGFRVRQLLAANCSTVAACGPSCARCPRPTNGRPVCVSKAGFHALCAATLGAQPLHPMGGRHAQQGAHTQEVT
jgi:hypothetical protein